MTNSKSGSPQKETGFFTEQNIIILFSIVGIAAIRIWIQSALYSNYTASDNGITTLIINSSRVVFMMGVVVLAASSSWVRKHEKPLLYVSVVAMTLASVAFVIQIEFPSSAWAKPLFWFSSIAGAGGLTGVGGFWAIPFSRMRFPVAFSATFGGLALGSLGGLINGFITPDISYLIGMLMPVTALVCWQRTMVMLPDDRDKRGHEYDEEPTFTFVRMFAGLAFIEIALGISRGYPTGLPIPLSVEAQIIHQVGIVVISLLLIYFVVFRGATVNSIVLWVIEITLCIAGVLFLAVRQPWSLTVGATSVAMANTLILGILWFVAYDIMRHKSGAPYIGLGIIWAIFISARGLGRLGILLVNPSPNLYLFEIMAMLLLLGVGVYLLFGRELPSKRPLFDKREAEASACGVENEEVSDEGEKRLIQLPEYRIPDNAGLTKREKEVIVLMLQGKSKAEVGSELYISENTVRGHVKNIYTKLDVHNKTELRQACAR